jgi:hypothetical protein
VNRDIFEDELRTYTISHDDTVPLGMRLWGIVQARVVDELTVCPPQGGMTIDSDIAAFQMRVIRDSVIGGIGVPRDVFSQLAPKNFKLGLAIRSNGYAERKLTVDVAPKERHLAASVPLPLSSNNVISLDNIDKLSIGNALIMGTSGSNQEIVTIRSFGPGPNQVTINPALRFTHNNGDPVVPVVPDDFRCIDLGAISLHREPVMIRGRAVKQSVSAVLPLAGVSVRISGLWKSMPSSGGTLPSLPNIACIQPPLYADRRSTMSILSSINMTTPGPEGRLVGSVQAKDRKISISGLTLSPAEIVAIDVLHPDLTEYVEITSVLGGGITGQHADVTLAHPLAYSHRRDATIQVAVPIPSPTIQFMDADAIAGDTSIFLTGMGGFGGATFVQIAGGVAAYEYHKIQFYKAASYADGFFRLPPISRVAQVELEAKDSSMPPPNTLTKKVYLDYSQREQQVDFVFQ